MLKLVFYVPEDQKEHVKEACFLAGAGKIGAYERCAWECRGQGQFYPNATSNPSVGERHMLTTLSEVQVTMVLSEDCCEATLTALLNSHPYETPAYHVIPFYTQDTLHELIPNKKS